MRLLCAFFGLCAIVINPIICQSTDSSHHNREDLIEDTLKKLLGVKIGNENMGMLRKTQPLPPKYMMELYEKYRSGQTPMQGNTVRSILPMKGSINKADMLIFNLTGIKPDERILQSKLYFLKRKKPKHYKKRDLNFKIKVGSLPDMTSQQWIHLSLTSHKSQWNSYDITGSVEMCRQNQNGNHLLGLTVHVRKNKGKYKQTSFRRIIKSNSQPFVLIFSEDYENHTQIAPKKETISYDEIGELLRAKAEQEGTQPGNIASKDYIKSRRTRSINKDFSGHYIWDSEELIHTILNDSIESTDNEKLFDDVNTKPQAEIYSNALNSDKTSLLNEHIIQNNNSHTVKERTRKMLIYLKQILNKANNSALLSQLFLENQSYKQNSNEIFWKRSLQNDINQHSYKQADHVGSYGDPNKISSKERNKNPQIILMPHHQNPRIKGKKAKKRRKKGRRRQKLPFWWVTHDHKLHRNDKNSLCKRKSLVVQFSDLGWNDWIIAPESFNAHYCSGTCPFSLIIHKNAKSTNHAAIQSLVHEIGLMPEIPSPCCVPSVTSPLTVLYTDESGSVVLKKYPNMIVEKCACR